MCPPASEEAQSHALLCFFPSNPKVQVEAVEGGALQKLLVILATEQPLTAKKKVGFCSPSPAQTRTPVEPEQQESLSRLCTSPWGPGWSSKGWRRAEAPSPEKAQ